jgi:hypothetical protein
MRTDHTEILAAPSPPKKFLPARHAELHLSKLRSLATTLPQHSLVRWAVRPLQNSRTPCRRHARQPT